MRAFIVLCLIAVACADKLGYNYQPVSHSDSGLSFAPGSGGGILSSGSLGGGSLGVGSFGGGSLGGGSLGGGSLGGGSFGVGSFGGGSLGGGSLGGGSLGGGSFGVGSLGGGSLGGGSLGGGNLGGISLGGGDSDIGDGSVGHDGASVGGGELEKEFYIFSAKEDDFEAPADSEKISNSLKQRLRVVFIKGPENNGLQNAAINLAKHASEQQTAIYVLSKQADIAELANKFNAIHDSQAHKPEVHFVKYRTAQDAANAQHAIQSQYDGLGGSSKSHDGGVAPVLNFASHAPVASHGGHGFHGGHSSHGGQIGFTGTSGLGVSSGSGIGSVDGGFDSSSGGVSFDSDAPSTSYLPASLRRRFRV